MDPLFEPSFQNEIPPDPKDIFQVLQQQFQEQPLAVLYSDTSSKAIDTETTDSVAVIAGIRPGGRGDVVITNRIENGHPCFEIIFNTFGEPSKRIKVTAERATWLGRLTRILNDSERDEVVFKIARSDFSDLDFLEQKTEDLRYELQHTAE